MSRPVLALFTAISISACSLTYAQQCADGIDNNANDLIDMADPYCRSPSDNDESSFASGIPGDDQNSPGSLDCWFDGNGGSGDDDCTLHACCLIAGPCPENLSPQTFDPNECTVSQTCIDSCQPITKPGCDCFGCCTICPPGQSCTSALVHPVISPTCTIESLADEAACLPCNAHQECRVWPVDVFGDGFELLQLLN